MSAALELDWTAADTASLVSILLQTEGEARALLYQSRQSGGIFRRPGWCWCWCLWRNMFARVDELMGEGVCTRDKQ